MAHWTNGRERSVGKKQSERERPRSGPSPGSVGDALNTSYNHSNVRIETNRTETSMKAPLGTVVNIRRSDRFILHLELWKMSKLSFRARALDASKPLPVFRCEDLPDLHEYASINRAVPQMPTGMEKEEESVCFNRLKIWIYTFCFIFTWSQASLFFLRKLSQNGRQFSQEKHDGFVPQTTHIRGSDGFLGKAGMLCVVIG